MNIKRLDILSLLDKLEVLEKANEELSRRTENINRGIRLVKYELKEFVNDITNYERLKKEESDFLELGCKIDQLIIEDADILTREEMNQVVINNIYAPVNENNNRNHNSLVDG